MIRIFKSSKLSFTVVIFYFQNYTIFEVVRLVVGCSVVILRNILKQYIL